MQPFAEIPDYPQQLTLATEQNREMYVSILELETLRQRLQRIRNLLGSIDGLKAISSVHLYDVRMVRCARSWMTNSRAATRSLTRQSKKSF